jgi:hypothetical protein
MRIRAALLAIGIALTGCGGDKKEVDEPTASDQDAPPTAEQQKLAKLRAQQEGTCGPMCERITECSVADARANMTAEELAQLDLDKTAPAHTEKCTEECNARSLSPRQIQVVRECLSQPLECPAYLDCLDAARPK